MKRVTPQRLYRWQALDARGQRASGHLQSPGPKQALYALQNRGLRQVKLRRSHPLLLQPVRRRDITLLTRQLATLLAAGLPLLQALQVLGQGVQHPRLLDLLQQLRSSLETGESLSAACAHHPKHFEPVYVHLVAAGEQSGLLDEMLERLAEHLERSQTLHTQVRAALTYPVAVMLVALVVVGVLMVKVVPAFTQAFSSYGAELPVPTQIVMGISAWLQAHGLWLLLGPWAVWAVLKAFRHRSQHLMRSLRDVLQPRMRHWPLIGTLALHIALTRWSRTLATLCGAGVPLMQALHSAGQASAHVVVQEASGHLAQQIEQGQALSQAMEALQLYPPMVLQLCAVGEVSGTLDAMLAKAADVMDVQVQARLKSLVSLLEPTLMVVLGSLIGGMVVAMYLPIFKMGQVI